MNSKIKLDENYYFENDRVIFKDKNKINIIFTPQQVHAIELLFKEYTEQNLFQNQ